MEGRGAAMSHLSHLPLLALKTAPVSYSSRGYAGMPNPWLQRAQKEALQRLASDGDERLLTELRASERRVTQLVNDLRTTRRALDDMEELEQELQLAKDERDRLAEAMIKQQIRADQRAEDRVAGWREMLNAEEGKTAQLKQELQEAENRIAALERAKSKQPVPAPETPGPSEPFRGFVPTPSPTTPGASDGGTPLQTPREVRDMERTALEQAYIERTEELRKERGILTEEEKLVAVKEQQAQMQEFTEFANNPEKGKAMTPQQRSELFVTRDMGMALLSDEELARLYRALVQVYTGEPIDQWNEETKQALIQTLVPANATEEQKRAALEQYATPKFRTAAETLVGLIGTWLNIKGPKKRKDAIEKEQEEKRIAAEQLKEENRRIQEKEAKKKAEDKLNKEVYEQWEETWRRIAAGDFPDDDEAKDIQSRFKKNQYLRLLLLDNPKDQAQASVWNAPNFPRTMTEPELRGLIHHLKPYANKNSQLETKILAFRELLIERLKTTDAVKRLPKFMRNVVPTPGTPATPAEEPQTERPPMGGGKGGRGGLLAGIQGARGRGGKGRGRGGLLAGIQGARGRGGGRGGGSSEPSEPPQTPDDSRKNLMSALNRAGNEETPPTRPPNPMAGGLLSALQAGKQLRRLAEPGDQVPKAASAPMTSSSVADVTWLAGVQRAIGEGRGARRSQ